jgi:hypothetical protein
MVFKHAFDYENYEVWKCVLNKSCLFLCGKENTWYIRSSCDQNIFLFDTHL